MENRLYRGKTKNGNLYFGDLVHKFCFEPQGYIIECAIVNNNDWVEVIPSTVGQSIGIKDKNGVEIFEGDIVRYNYHIETPGTDYICEVIFDIRNIDTGNLDIRHIGFILRGIERDGEYWYTEFPDIKDIEIIGNVPENPELLEKT